MRRRNKKLRARQQARNTIIIEDIVRTVNNGMKLKKKTGNVHKQTPKTLAIQTIALSKRICYYNDRKR